jgi:hypothetical protein
MAGSLEMNTSSGNIKPRSYAMHLFALVQGSKVTRLVESEEMPGTASPFDTWVDVTGNTEVAVNDRASFNGGWTFTKPTNAELISEINYESLMRLRDIDNRLLLSSAQFKVDLGVADLADVVLLQTCKQYAIAISDINKQPGYPQTVNWPVAPF